jgi:hypothetical protein
MFIIIGGYMTPEEAFIQATKFRAKAYYYLYEELSKGNYRFLCQKKK